jgi:hypothetical protein
VSGGPPGGAGDHQTLPGPDAASWSECRRRAAERAEHSLVSRPGPGAAVHPSPVLPALPALPAPRPPALRWDARPKAPPASFAAGRSPSPKPPRDPCPAPQGCTPGFPRPPRREQARGAAGGEPREARPGGEGWGGGGRGAVRVSHLFSWPRRGRDGRDFSRSAFSFCFMEPCAWVGAPREAGPQAGRTRGAGRAGRRRPAGKRRRKRPGGGGSREELEVFPGRLED